MDFSKDQQCYYRPFSKLLFKAEIELKGVIFLNIYLKDKQNYKQGPEKQRLI